MEYAYKVTTNGRAVMAACMALEKPFHTTRVTFGSGKVDENTNLADVHQLLEYVSDGAVADRRHQDDRFYLTIQYANSEHKEVPTFLLSEFIVYVEDPENGGETDLLYGTLGDYRQPVPVYNPAYPPSVFNFPLELILSSELQVLNSAPAGIATWNDLRDLKSEIIHSIMTGEVTLPLTAANGEALLTSGGASIQARYRLERSGSVLDTVAALEDRLTGQIGQATANSKAYADGTGQAAVLQARDYTDGQLTAHNTADTAHPSHLTVVTTTLRRRTP